jgi:hypothetical protein
MSSPEKSASSDASGVATTEIRKAEMVPSNSTFEGNFEHLTLLFQLHFPLYYYMRFY